MQAGYKEKEAKLFRKLLDAQAKSKLLSKNCLA